jgi:hypothetical protein
MARYPAGMSLGACLEARVPLSRRVAGLLLLTVGFTFPAGGQGTGLDTVPLPGDITEEQLARIIGDVATLAYKWNKPLSARLLPAPGKKAGERTEFNDPRLANATLQALP